MVLEEMCAEDEAELSGTETPITAIPPPAELWDGVCGPATAAIFDV